MRKILLLVLFITLPNAAFGEPCDSREDVPLISNTIKSISESLSAQQTSEYDKDEVFGTYEGYNLDQYLFREDGVIEFPIKITRVFSRDKTDWNNLIIGTPQLVLRVWDVDANCGTACGGCCEVDKVYINNNLIGVLDGANSSWSTVRFDIPIEWFEQKKVMDATYNGSDQEPTPGENWIKIEINTTCGSSCWAVECDYGEFQIKGMRPAALFHGLNLKMTPGGSTNSWKTFRTFIPGELCEAYALDGNGSLAVNSKSVVGYINRAIKEFGTKEINIIAHSKGGLDSTDAVIGKGNKVENIITLASPLLGTEYADHFYAKHRWSMPRSDEVALNELRTRTRATYYTTHQGPTPGITYYHLGCNGLAPKDSECPMPLDGTLMFTVNHDGLVPINRTFPAWGTSPNRRDPYTHSQPLDESVIGQWCVNIMKGSVSTTTTPEVQSINQSKFIANKLSQQTLSIGPQHTFVISETLVNGETKIFDVPIDSSTSQTTFVIIYGSELDFDLVLIDPFNNYLTTPTSKGSIPGTSLAEISYQFENPNFGTWKMEVHANSDGEFRGTAELTTTLLLTAYTNKESFQAGDPIEIRADLENTGNPLVGATVTASLANFSGFSDKITLVDNNDGSYTTTYLPSEGGYFTITIEAEGNSPENFQRDVKLNVLVSPSTGNIVSIVSENVNDSDGDGLYDNLELVVNVDIIKEGSFRLIGILRSNDETVIVDASASGNYAIGSQNISLIFDGSIIHDSGKNGPYLLSDLILEDIDNQGITTDKKTDFHSTQPYYYYNFEGPVISLGTGMDYTTDSNGDGLFNLLTVKIEVLVSPGYQGYYNYNAELQDANGNGIVWYSNPSQYLSAGLNIISLTFSGYSIYNSGLDGPYNVANFHLYNRYNSEIQISSPKVHTTTRYCACQFQGAPLPACICNESQSPIANAGGPYTGSVGTPIELDASGSYDPDGTIVRYKWDWDNDGIYDESTISPTITHVWNSEYIGIVKLMVTDDDGLSGDDTTSVEVTITSITAIINIDPDALHIKSKGKWITCYIELPEGYNVADIIVSSITLNESITAELSPTEIGDNDNDNVLDLMVKFDRQTLIEMLESSSSFDLTVSGNLNGGGTRFEGTDSIKLVH